jgi:formylglycine-generating enzyme required for sulfatase activity
VPVVGISWYETNAYCRWLQCQWVNLEESQANTVLDLACVRLPTEAEWLRSAGGEQTKSEQEIQQRANVVESGIRRTTNVAMYPLGGNQSYGLYDLAGNVWEWCANYADKDHSWRVLRGGSWVNDPDYARCAARCWFDPDDWNFGIGFRVVVSPSTSGLWGSEIGEQ